MISVEENAVLCRICEEVTRKNGVEGKIEVACQNSKDIDVSKYPKVRDNVSIILIVCRFAGDRNRGRIAGLLRVWRRHRGNSFGRSQQTH